MNEATWINGKRSIKGRWSYYRPSDCFFIELEQIDRVTGQKKTLKTHNDTPEWGNWKLVRDK